MDRKRAKELLPIIEAYAEGKTIQYKTSDEWTDDPNFSPEWEFQYRIKPEPKEWWLCWDNKFDIKNVSVWDSPAYDDCIDHYQHRVKVREAL